MLVKRCGTREALIAALGLVAACSRGEAPGVDAGTSDKPASSAPIHEATARAEVVAVDSIHRATAALDAWTGCEAGPRYGLLRRALAAVEPFARTGSRRATEVLFGPLRPADEGAGAVGALDVALAAHDCREASSQRFQIASALELMSVEIVDGRRLGEAKTARALSDAAFDLGLATLEARVSSSAFDEADRGEALGLTDAIEAGMKALWPDLAGSLDHATADVRAIRSAIEQAPSMTRLADRARLTRMTGPVGLAIRAAARSHGLDVRAPHRSSPATDAAVSALSLPPPRARVDPELAALGARLFTDRRLSAKRQSSCATCHDPARAYTEPRATPISLDPAHPLLRNTPTLLYNDLQATQLWDGRIVTAEAQVLRVIHNHAELGLDDAELVIRVSADPAYAAGFAAREGGVVTAAGIAAALGAHIASLGAGTSPVDAYARGDDAALSAEMGRGLDVFAGPGRCARCHVPPLWGGSRPTDFAVPVYAVLGVPTRPEARKLDSDAGREGVTHRIVDKGSFKTPSIRDVARTGPYMHHGRFATLEQVVDFYDRGGGRGIGLVVPEQDPDVRPLRLTPEDRRALLVFLREGALDAP